MSIDEPVVLKILDRCMVARIATLSRHGRPSVNPLYFVHRDGVIWLGTADWTLAARNVKANQRVSILFEVEQDPASNNILRISGRASVQTNKEVVRSYGIHVIGKYILTAGGIRNALSHLRQIPLQRDYRAQSARKGHTCVIEVTPQQVELLANDKQGC